VWAVFFITLELGRSFELTSPLDRYFLSPFPVVLPSSLHCVIEPYALCFTEPASGVGHTWAQPQLASPFLPTPRLLWPDLSCMVVCFFYFADLRYLIFSLSLVADFLPWSCFLFHTSVVLSSLVPSALYSNLIGRFFRI